MGTRSSQLTLVRPAGDRVVGCKGTTVVRTLTALIAAPQFVSAGSPQTMVSSVAMAQLCDLPRDSLVRTGRGLPGAVEPPAARRLPKSGSGAFPDRAFACGSCAPDPVTVGSSSTGEVTSRCYMQRIRTSSTGRVHRCVRATRLHSNRELLEHLRSLVDRGVSDSSSAWAASIRVERVAVLIRIAAGAQAVAHGSPPDAETHPPLISSSPSVRQCPRMHAIDQRGNLVAASQARSRAARRPPHPSPRFSPRTFDGSEGSSDHHHSSACVSCRSLVIGLPRP